MTDCTISGNTANGVGGGILNVYKNGTLTMTGCTLSGSLSAAGGNIASIGATLAMAGCTISYGTATTYGGGLLNDGSANLVACAIYGNVAPDAKSGSSYSGTGGGILNESSLKLTACTVSGNSAALAGGGIGNMQPPNLGKYHLGYSLAMYDCTVSANTVEAYGGGIYNAKAFSLDMIDCTVSGNSVTFPEVNGKVVGYGQGGGIRNAGTLTMTDCTVFGNSANDGTDFGQGGGIDNIGTATLTNCTLTANTASINGNGVHIGGDIFTFGIGMSMNNCIVAGSILLGGDIVGSASGDNNFVDDPTTAGVLANGVNGNIVQSEDPVLSVPGFYGGLTETMVPLPGSPVIGMGDPSLIPRVITTDQRGAPRTRGGKVDMGATESGPITITVNTLADNVNLPIIDGSVTTLREAINYASADAYAGDAITFAAGLTGTIALAQGALPAITTPVATIVGPGANVLTIDAQGKSSIFSIDSGATVIIAGLTLANGSADHGGAIVNLGTLVMAGCALSGNTATNGYGGGIDNYGTLSLTNCTIAGNSATRGNGGGIANVGTLTLTNCTISGNTAEDGGGVGNVGTLTLTNCTISGNTAEYGGGIENDFGASAILDNTIVAGNSSDILGSVSGSHNLIGDTATGDGLGTGGLTNGVNGNLLGLDPKLGPLANNGGPTQTMALLAGSPAINAGDNTLVPSEVDTDQRGAVRVKDGTVDIGAFESGQSSIVVTTLADSNASGLTLREAIDYVNNIDPQGGVTITFAPGLEGTIALTQGMLPAIAGNLAIDGPGANLLTIDAQGNSSILSIEGGSNVVLIGLTLAHGSTLANPVGGIANWGKLAMTDCTVTGNAGADGGGVANYGTLSMIESTVSHNSTELNSVGGGLFNDGTMTLINSTVANNFALYGGGLFNDGSGTLTLDDCTIAGNTAQPGLGGGIDNAGTGTVTLENTIVAASHGSPGGDIAGTVSGSNNLIDDAATAGGLTNGASGNLVGVDPQLGALGYNGGPTQTMALLPGSPAIDAGSNAPISLGIIADQRGAPRLNGKSVDIGAFESGPTTIVVTSLADVNSTTIDLFAPDGITLREAIAFAGADPSGDTIVFSPLLKGAIDLSQGALPTITNSLTIDGPGANVLTIDAQGQSGILSIASGAQVNISGLTLANGSASVSPGGGRNTSAGGAIANQGTLAITGCTLTGNIANFGGAIANTGSLTLNNSTLSASFAYDNGGAIYNHGSLSLTDCTVSGNTADTKGGGIYGYSGTSLTLTDCTISGNSTNLGLGGGIFGLNVILNNTIVANSGSGGDIWGTASGSNNLIDDANSAGGLSNGVNGNLVGVDPKLGTLEYNGGPTRTMALLTGSPAIGTGAAGGVTTDQRGFGLDSPKPDIGAFQYQGTPPTVAITVSGPTTQPTLTDFTFDLTATDPAPADQSGTFTYTIDWNGDGSDIQTIQGPASLQVTHAYSAANSYTSKVTVLDQNNRSSGPAALAAPVVVTALSTQGFGTLIQTGSVTLVASTTEQVALALNTINNAPPSAWGANSVTLSVVNAPLDIVVNPTSPSAQVNIGEQQYNTINWSELSNTSNPYASGGSEGLTIATEVLGLIAVGFITGAASGAAGGLAGVELSAFLTVPASGGSTVLVSNLVIATGVATTSILSGVLAGATVGGLGTLAYVAAGASPALTVDQGTVNASNGVFSTATDSPTIIVRGGTLNLQDDVISGNFAGSQPLIEVDGGTLILGDPDGTHANVLAAFGSAPFVHVAGTGMVIVEPGTAFDQISFDQVSGEFTYQAAGSTSVGLVSSEPTASPGDTITLTANVTAAGAAATDGSVEFFDNTTGAFLGLVAVSNGSAAIQATFNALTAGDTIYATYLPTTGAMSPSSGLTTQVVAEPTQTAVTGPSTTPTYGQKATFTATVTDNTPSGGTPTGSVEFFDGSNDIGPATLVSSGASSATYTFSTSKLWAGTHTIDADYTPSGLFQQSHGSLTNQVINQRPITVTAAPNTKPYDGTNSAAAAPTITSGSLVSGDMPDFTESYATVNVGTGLTLVPGGTVDDGNGGNNYAVKFVNSTNGTITQYAFTYQIGNDSHVYGTTANFATDLGITFSTGVNHETLGISYNSTGNTTTALVGTYSITATLSNGTGLLSNYKVTLNNGTLSVTALPGSVFVLDPKASGALTVSGSARLKVAGNLIVDSDSSSALTTTGTASVTAAATQVTGGYQKGSGTTINPAPVTGVTAVPDPLGGPAGPSPSGMTNYGAVNLSGTATKTIQPGIYTSIAVSNSAKLTLASNGIYIIEGGGLSISGNGSISGTNVLIVNAGSKYPTIGGNQTYGSITLSNSGAINVSPYTTTGTYAGLVIFQTTDNKQAMTFSGSATGAITGTIYAAAAALSVSNGAMLQGGLIVDTLAVSGTAVAQVVKAGSPAGPIAAPVAVPLGPLGLGGLAPPSSGPGTGSCARPGTGRPGAGALTAAVTSMAASSRPVAMGLVGGSEGPDSSLLEDSELLTDVAVSLIVGQRAGSEDSAPASSKARA